MVRIAVATLGCKVNQYESAGIIEELEKRGAEIVPFDEPADVYIVNTCTVTGRTDYQSRQLIRKANRKNPSASIVVTGCYAQTSHKALSSLPGVKLIVGMEDKEVIPDMIDNVAGTEQRIVISDIGLKKTCSDLPVTRFPGRTRAFLKIQDGCDSFCSYCIIPYARGRSRSLPEKKVIRRMELLAGSGYREVVLTGIHIGNYGRDFTPPSGLSDLLKKIDDKGIIERLRISSIEPLEVTDDMINLIKTSQTICRHLHIPLQNGDDNILRLMKRNYDTNRFKDLVKKILDSVPEMAIGTDVMVGFPKEGEKEFENTLKFIEETPFSYLHVFPYSKRPGTEASGMSGQVQEIVKKNRGKILRDTGKRKREEFNERFIGKRLSVLVEDARDGKTGLMKGFSDNYIPVLIRNGKPASVNRIVEVVAENTADGKIIGREDE